MDSVKPSSSHMYSDTFPLSSNFDSTSVLFNGQFSENLFIYVSFGCKETLETDTLCDCMKPTSLRQQSKKSLKRITPVLTLSVVFTCPDIWEDLPKFYLSFSKLNSLFLMIMERIDCFPHHNYSFFKDKMSTEA